MKSILDPGFQYVRSERTDVRQTFERVRREMQAGGAQARQAGAQARPMATSRQAGAARGVPPRGHGAGSNGGIESPPTVTAADPAAR
jgi:hypothetical protein